MEGPTSVSSLIHAATMVAAGVFLIARVYPIFDPLVLNVMVFIGAFTAFMAATIALTQNDIKRIFLDSLIALGMNLEEHDIQFIDDNWESPVFGAKGVGWEVWLAEEEIAQLTYLQECGGIACSVVPIEITYGLERLTMLIQGVDTFDKIFWTDKITYGDVHFYGEIEQCIYNFEASNPELLFKLFDLYRGEVKQLIQRKLVIPSLDYILKMAHTFNLLDAREKFSNTERLAYIEEIRNLAKCVAQNYLLQRESMGFLVEE
jgi:glycyl-tRNA synthetase alpha chain